MSLSFRGRIVVSWDCGEDIVCGARFHSVECIALLSSTGPRKSAMDSKGVRRLYLLLRPKGRLSPGRKTPPGVSAPSAGLRPLIVSRVKCGGRTLSQPLSEVPYELSTDAHSKKCKRSPQQFIPAGFPPHDNFQPGTKDSAGPRHTGHGPFRARPPASNNKAGE